MRAMGRLTALAVLIAGCGFHSPPGPAESPGGDASAGCTAGFLDLCAQAEPSTMFEVAGAQAINTDNDPRCRTLTQAGGGDVCLIYATAVVIESSAVLTATGKRPLAIASASRLTLNGAIDAGSHGAQRGPGADDAACTFATVPANDAGGGGGAAGGSFALPGGDGGAGDQNRSGGAPTVAAPGTHGATTTISVLRGGCPGQPGGDEGSAHGQGHGGRGGHSGGALYLFARERIEIAGVVRATGAGGDGGDSMAGGGGGGTGGLVVIESPSIANGGQISANGGGGGQGGGFIVTGTGVFKNAVRIPGNPGHDGDLGPTAAAGGSGAASGNPGFGPGGAGGASTAAGSGTAADLGGGGGGGAAGVVMVRGRQPQLSGVLSPAPAMP
jgi:hypothetical protein